MSRSIEPLHLGGAVQSAHAGGLQTSLNRAWPRADHRGAHDTLFAARVARSERVTLHGDLQQPAARLPHSSLRPHRAVDAAGYALRGYVQRVAARRAPTWLFARRRRSVSNHRRHCRYAPDHSHAGHRDQATQLICQCSSTEDQVLCFAGALLVVGLALCLCWQRRQQQRRRGVSSGDTVSPRSEEGWKELNAQSQQHKWHKSSPPGHMESSSTPRPLHPLLRRCVAATAAPADDKQRSALCSKRRTTINSAHGLAYPDACHQSTMRPHLAAHTHVHDAQRTSASVKLFRCGGRETSNRTNGRMHVPCSSSRAESDPWLTKDASCDGTMSGGEGTGLQTSANLYAPDEAFAASIGSGSAEMNSRASCSGVSRRSSSRHRQEASSSAGSTPSPDRPDSAQLSGSSRVGPCTASTPYTTVQPSLPDMADERLEIEGVLGGEGHGQVFAGSWRGLEAAIKTALFQVRAARAAYGPTA